MTNSIKPRYDWYQDNEKVVVNILVKGMSPENVSIQFAPRSVDFKYTGADGNVIELALALDGVINPSESTFRVSPVKAEIKLRKAVANLRWEKLEAAQAKEQSAAPAAPMAPVPSAPIPDVFNYQSRIRSLEQEIKSVEEEEKQHGGPEDLFRDIFKNSDEDTRRAMLKSFQESNGTVLSTNWKEVGAKKVDMQPPESSEWKQW